MSHCPECQATIKGDWDTCPLCHSPLSQASEEKHVSAYRNVPLRFSRKKIKQILTAISLVTILLYFTAHYIWRFRFFGLEYVLFGLMIMWLMVLVLIRKRRNIVKGIAYILFLFSLVSLYFDYTTGWLGWSLTFVIPILCISALFAMFVAIQVVHLEATDYVLYLQLAAIVGLIPALFMIMDWVVIILPSALSVLFSLIMLVSVLIKHRLSIVKELGKRMHV